MKCMNAQNTLLCIRSYNRPDYLEQTMKSVMEADGEYKIIIYDDGSNDAMTLDLLNKGWDDVEIVRNEQNVGCYKSYTDLLDYIVMLNDRGENQIQYVCIMDNDVIVRKDFMMRLYTTYQECEKVFGTHDIVLSGFRPTNAHLGQERTRYEWFHERETVGAVCYFFNIKFIDIIKSGWILREDFGISDVIEEKGMHFCCMNASLVNHVGEIGLHSMVNRFDTDEEFVYIPVSATPISTTPISTTSISTTPISTTPISTTPISTNDEKN